MYYMLSKPMCSTGGTDAATPFVLGGALGMFYQQSLQFATDSLPASINVESNANTTSKTKGPVCPALLVAVVQ